MSESHGLAIGTADAMRAAEPFAGSDAMELGTPVASAAELHELHEEADRAIAAMAASVYRARQRRSRHFKPDLFSEPAWDMLLDLFVSKTAGKPVSTVSLCLAAGTPATTGLRWMAKLEEHGLVRRYRIPEDRRLALVEITPDAYRSMRQYVAEEIRLLGPS